GAETTKRNKGVGRHSQWSGRTRATPGPQEEGRLSRRSRCARPACLESIAEEPSGYLTKNGRGSSSRGDSARRAAWRPQLWVKSARRFAILAPCRRREDNERGSRKF